MAEARRVKGWGKGFVLENLRARQTAREAGSGHKEGEWGSRSGEVESGRGTHI